MIQLVHPLEEKRREVRTVGQGQKLRESYHQGSFQIGLKQFLGASISIHVVECVRDGNGSACLEEVDVLTSDVALDRNTAGEGDGHVPCEYGLIGRALRLDSEARLGS